MRRSIVTTALALLLALAPAAEAGVRIKDITDFEGARSNQLVGVGLVVGLNGTGSRQLATQQMAVEMLQKFQFGSTIYQNLPSDNVFKSTNISMVTVTAEIGPFSRKGSRIDVTVSTLDDALSLQGGTLILTPLRGADNQDYAVSQGPLSVGGFAFAGQAASVQKNHPTVGRIAGGATVEKEAHGEIVCHGQIRLLLRDPDYDTARAVAKVINDHYPCSAAIVDAGAVQVVLPRELTATPAIFASEIGVLEVLPDVPARVVINERTGTIVAGDQVKVSTVAIAHGNLAIIKAELPEVSQPNEFAQGRTVVVPRTQVGVTEQRGSLHVVEHTVTVGKLAQALNALGVTPRDLISIFQTLKSAGALHADLILQ